MIFLLAAGLFVDLSAAREFPIYTSNCASNLLMKSGILPWLFFLTALCSAQNGLREPVSCGDVNNTSASPRFHSAGNGNARPGNVSQLPLRSLLYPGASTRLYTRFMPWFGDSKHKDVGYRSDDPEQIA